MTTRVGYVGLDHHHREPYLHSMAELPLTVTATAEPNDGETVECDRLAETTTYGSPEELIDAGEIDLVWLTCSNRDTPELIQHAAERGIDVFTEKPAGRTAAELVAIEPAVRESDAVVGFSYAWRGNPLSVKLKELASEGVFGDVRGFDLRFVASQLAARDTSHYLFDSASSRGGITQWLGVHWIDLLPWILDDPIARVCARMRYGTDTVDIEDGATVQFETESGAIGTLSCGYYLREGQYDTLIQIYGEETKSRWQPVNGTFEFEGESVVELDSNGADADSQQIIHEYTTSPGYGGNWGLDFFEQFLAARKGDAPLPADIDDAIRVLGVLDAAYESAESGEWVTVENTY